MFVLVHTRATAPAAAAICRLARSLATTVATSQGIADIGNAGLMCTQRGALLVYRVIPPFEPRVPYDRDTFKSKLTNAYVIADRIIWKFVHHS